MVEVFKTTVKEEIEAEVIISQLRKHFPECKINFDLDDCDKILRLEGSSFVVGKVMRIVHENGYKCIVLD